MKNKIEFPENNDIKTGQLINQTSAGSSFDQNLNSELTQKIKSFKIIKGKVKTYKNNNKVKLVNNDWLEDKEELDIVSKRMSLFLKFTFFSLIIISLFISFKKNAL